MRCLFLTVDLHHREPCSEDLRRSDTPIRHEDRRGHPVPSIEPQCQTKDSNDLKKNTTDDEARRIGVRVQHIDCLVNLWWLNRFGYYMLSIPVWISGFAFGSPTPVPGTWWTCIFVSILRGRKYEAAFAYAHRVKDQLGPTSAGQMPGGTRIRDMCARVQFSTGGLQKV